MLWGAYTGNAIKIMAGIDKTYINNCRDYMAAVEWAKDKSFMLKNGEVVRVSDFILYPDMTEKMWEEMKERYINSRPELDRSLAESWFEVVLWNTPTYLDIWLIRNCPLEFIQKRLMEQYGGGWSKEAFTDHNFDDMYNQIKNGTSVYDTFKRNGLGEDARVVFKNFFSMRAKRVSWSFHVEYGDKTMWYSERDKAWYFNEEAMPISSNTCFIGKPLTKKNIVKLVKGWNLPAGTSIDALCWFHTSGHRYCILNKIKVRRKRNRRNGARLE